MSTSRLILRPTRLSDAPRVQELFPHWDVVKFMSTVIPWPYPIDGAERYMEYSLGEIAAGKRYGWAITLKEHGDDLLIGMIELFPDNPTDNRGFWITRDYWRQGYMSEAVAAVNDFAFETLGVPSLILNNAEPNIGSHRLKEKSGAVITGMQDDVSFVSGKFRSIRWLLTAEQWRLNRGRFIPLS